MLLCLKKTRKFQFVVGVFLQVFSIGNAATARLIQIRIITTLQHNFEQQYNQNKKKKKQKE